MNGKALGKVQNPNKYIFEKKLAIGRFSDFPVNPVHVEIVTKRHVETFFETTKDEKLQFLN